MIGLFHSYVGCLSPVTMWIKPTYNHDRHDHFIDTLVSFYLENPYRFFGNRNGGDLMGHVFYDVRIDIKQILNGKIAGNFQVYTAGKRPGRVTFCLFGVTLGNKLPSSSKLQ